MSAPATRGDGVAARVLAIVAILGVMVALIVSVDATLSGRRHAGDRAAAPLGAPDDPIAAEAQVFRTRPSDLAVDPGEARRRPAHPRTLATFRGLRAFPGAPPRIPHGLTAEEFRTGTCNTCHARGGYSPRFGAYVPVTPHPEYADCLQCHVGDDVVIGIDLPGQGPDAVCRQCHLPGAVRSGFAPLDWRPAAWPATGASELPGSPPPIPHPPELRGNCVACHAGPGAVAEIRTRHADRANCRQCHMQAAPEVGEFTRPVRGDRGSR